MEEVENDFSGDSRLRWNDKGRYFYAKMYWTLIYCVYMKYFRSLFLLGTSVALLGGGCGVGQAPSQLQASTEYQAVFLNNGQAYFGKLDTKQQGQYLILRDIYYFQQLRPLQGEGKENPDLSLMKLGNELHGPTDMMQINRDHVLFVEDMKDDARVVQAIKSYKSK